jgi:hypothetical protein
MSHSIKQMRLAPSNRRSVPLLFLFAVFLASGDLRAQTTNWINVGQGDWFTATDWSNGVPNLSSTATIATAGTAQITGSTAQAADLTIGTSGGYPGYSSAVQLIGGASLEVSSSLTVNNNGEIYGSGNAPPLGAMVTIDPGGTVLNNGLIAGDNFCSFALFCG